jgi:hypothetical protein
MTPEHHPAEATPPSLDAHAHAVTASSTELRHDNHPTIGYPPPHPSHDREATSSLERSTLAEAQDYVSRGLRSGQQGAGFDPEWELHEWQWSLLIHWAKATLRDLSQIFRGPSRTGGREHDLEYDDAGQRWFKYTKPNACGYTVDWSESHEPSLANATVIQYLERLSLQNRLFGDSIELEGIWSSNGRDWRIVSSQPDIEGTMPTFEAIERGLSDLGCAKMRFQGIGYEASQSWRLGNYGLWDVHPANLVLTPDDVLVPIDLIITPLPDHLPLEHFHDSDPHTVRVKASAAQEPSPHKPS